MLDQWRQAEVEFEVDGNPIKFKVAHNLPDEWGLNIQCAVENWVVRTESFTAKSLCDYINGKNLGHTCMTMKQYNKLIKKLTP